MIDAVPNTCVLGQINPSGWSDAHISSIFVNSHACTPSCTVPAMTVATTWQKNIGRGGTFM